MKFIVILFLLFTFIRTLAQQSNSQLAYTYYQAKEYDKAELTFMDCSPGISDYAIQQKARSFCACFQDEEAAKLLSELKDRSEQVYIKAEALFQLAGLKRKQKELQQAKELYRLLVTDYSGSVYSIEAAKLYRNLEAGEQTEVNNL
ncbi:MAG: hypothetical protein ACLTSL_19300 [Odoribacter splanchnicus]